MFTNKICTHVHEYVLHYFKTDVSVKGVCVFQKLTVTEHMEAILRFLVSTKVGGRGDGYCTISCLTEGDI